MSQSELEIVKAECDDGVEVAPANVDMDGHRVDNAPLSEEEEGDGRSQDDLGEQSDSDRLLFYYEDDLCQLCGRPDDDDRNGLMEYGNTAGGRMLCFHDICLRCAHACRAPSERDTDGAHEWHNALDGRCLGIDVQLDELPHVLSIADERRCAVCCELRAAVECVDCERSFHLPCARDNGAFVPFAGRDAFKLTCPTCVRKAMRRGGAEPCGKADCPFESEHGVVCVICMDTVTCCADKRGKIVATDCCEQTRYYHHQCVADYVDTVGAESRCAMSQCESAEHRAHFQHGLAACGIYVNKWLGPADDDSLSDDEDEEFNSECMVCAYSKDGVPGGCLCPMGPRYFDAVPSEDNEAGHLFKWEPLNFCREDDDSLVAAAHGRGAHEPTGAHGDNTGMVCHRLCAGLPFAYNHLGHDEAGGYEEPSWVCPLCEQVLVQRDNTFDARPLEEWMVDGLCLMLLYGDDELSVCDSRLLDDYSERRTAGLWPLVRAAATVLRLDHDVIGHGDDQVEGAECDNEHEGELGHCDAASIVELD